MDLGDEDDMGGGLRVDVPERQKVSFFLNNLTRDFLACDLAEDTLCHESHYIKGGLEAQADPRYNNARPDGDLSTVLRAEGCPL